MHFGLIGGDSREKARHIELDTVNTAMGLATAIHRTEVSVIRIRHFLIERVPKHVQRQALLAT